MLRLSRGISRSKKQAGARRELRLARSIAFAAALFGPCEKLAAEEKVWIGTMSGNWSVDSQWEDGLAPAAGGDPSLILRFRGASGTATNNLGNPFQLNQLLLESSSPVFTIASAAGNIIQFSGVDPLIGMLGSGNVTVSSPLVLNSSNGSVRIGGAGHGNLLLSGVISETAAPQSLLISASPGGVNQQIITLGAANTFSGGVTLNSGNLALGNATALGTAPLTVAGGTLRLNGAISVSNNIVLQNDLLVSGAAGATLSGTISSETPGAGLVLRSSGGSLTLTGVSSHTGATMIDAPIVPGSVAGAGTLRLAGEASILQSSAVHVREGGTLRIDATDGAGDRVSDYTPFVLRSGNLLLSGVNGASLQTETVGAVSGAGYSTVTVTPISGEGSVQLIAASLARVERGTFLFRGTNLGTSSPVSGGNILFAAEPAGLTGGGGAGPDTSILPYAIGVGSSSGAGSNFVTWAPETGVRPLDPASEYAPSLEDAAATSNVRLASSVTLDGARTINSLVMAGGSLFGSGTLAVTSGAILGASTTTTISTGLAFGSAEANVFAVTPLTLLGDISGSNGLTKSGGGVLTLAGDNSFTGPLTINSGTISFTSLANLGADNSPIILAGTGARLTYSGSAALPMTRGIHLETETGSIALSGSSGDLLISGAITGPGGLRLLREPFSIGTITLTGESTYTGRTLVTGNLDLIINSDAALGSGGPLELFNAGRLVLAGPWESSRQIFLGGSGGSTPSQIDTAGFNAILDGVLAGGGGLAKLGEGKLVLRGSSAYASPVTIDGGALELSGAGSSQNKQWIVNPGGTLVIDNRVDAVSQRFSTSARITLDRGVLDIYGNASRSVAESITWLSVHGESRLNLHSQGSALTTLRVEDVNIHRHISVPFTGFPTVGGSVLLVRAENLGGPSDSGATRIIPNATLTGWANSTASGLATRIYTADSPTGFATSFVINDTTSDAAGVIGLRPLRQTEYSTGVIRNIVNGGSTEPTAHFLAGGEATVTGSENRIATLTMEAGGSVALADGQTLYIATGNILSRGNGEAASITGGTVNLGGEFGTLYTANDLSISSQITDSFAKLGPGTLTLSGVVSALGSRLPYQGFPNQEIAGIEVGGGVLRLNAGADVKGGIELHLGAELLIAGDSRAGLLLESGAITLSSGTLTVGSIDRDMVFPGFISGAGGLVIEGGAGGKRLRHFSAANTFSGGVTLQSGRLAVTEGGLGIGGALRINGGSLYAPAALSGLEPTRPISNPILASGDVRIDGPNSITLLPTATVSTSGAIEVRGEGGLIIQSPTEHTGETRSIFGFTEGITTPLGPIRLSGAQGSVAMSSGVRIGPGGAFIIDNTTAFTGSAAGRVSDTAAMHLHSGRLELIGNYPGAQTVERFGALTSAGYSTVKVTAGMYGGTLASASLGRVDRGTFLFQPATAGGGPWTNEGSIMISTPPHGLTGGGGAGPDTSILPYAIGDSIGTGIAIDYVTYRPERGISVLGSSGHVTSLAGAAPTNNVRISGTHVNNSDVTVNALMIGGTSAQSLEGAGSVRITSGLLVRRPGWNVEISTALDFGAAEGNIFSVRAPGAGEGRFTLSGVISGSGGLTKSGGDTLVLSAENTFTGPLTINSGLLQFTSLSNLGMDISRILVNGGAGDDFLSVNGPTHGAASGFRYTGATPITFGRDVEVSGGYATFIGSQPLTLAGNISGSGGVQLIYFAALAGSNSYTGPTLISGTVGIASNDAIAATDRVILDGFSVQQSSMKAGGSFSTDRQLEFRGSISAIDTAGFDLHWKGPLTDGLQPWPEFTRWRKVGAGRLTIDDARQYTGSIAVEGGVLALNGAMGGSISVGINGTLSGHGAIDGNVTVDGILAPGQDGPGILTAGSLAFGGPTGGGNRPTLALEIASPTLFDQVQVNGKVTFDKSVNLTLDLRYDPADDFDSFVIIANNGEDAINGFWRFMFNGRPLAEGAQFFAGAQEFRISYAGGTGNDVVLYAVPEPGSAALLAAGGLLLLRRRRRKSQL